MAQNIEIMLNKNQIEKSQNRHRFRKKISTMPLASKLVSIAGR